MYGGFRVVACPVRIVGIVEVLRELCFSFVYLARSFVAPYLKSIPNLPSQIDHSPCQRRRRSYQTIGS